MQNFKSQAHQRNHNGNVVVDNPGRTIAAMRERQKNRNLISGIIIGGMAMVVVVTGTLLGATTANNQKLQQKIATMEAHNHTAVVQQNTTMPDVIETTDDVDTTRYRYRTRNTNTDTNQDTNTTNTTRTHRRPNSHHPRPTREQISNREHQPVSLPRLNH